MQIAKRMAEQLSYTIMKKLIIHILLFILASQLFSQVNHQANVNRLIQQLDRQIEIAQNLLTTFQDQQATDLLRQVQKLGKDAAFLISQGKMGLARIKLNTALNLVNRVINRLSFVPSKRAKKQAEEVIRKAERMVSHVHSDKAEQLLKKAKQNQTLADRAQRKKEYRRATEYYRIARFLAERSIKLINRSGINIRERLFIEKERFDNLLNRAMTVSTNCNKPRAKKLLSEAIKQKELISSAIRKGNVKTALNIYYHTTRMLLRVINLCEGQQFSDHQQAIEDFEMLNDMIQSIQQDLGHLTRRQSLILNNVLRLQQEISDAIENDYFDIAVKKTRLARGLISKMWSMETDISIKTRALNEYERLSREIFDLENQSGIQNNKKLESVKAMAGNAKLYLDQGKIYLALQLLLAANRMLLAAQRNEPNQQIDSTRLQMKINQLEDEIDLRKDSINPDYIKSAKQLYQNALRAFDERNYQLAQEYTKLGLELLEKLERR